MTVVVCVLCIVGVVVENCVVSILVLVVVVLCRVVTGIAVIRGVVVLLAHVMAFSSWELPHVVHAEA